MKWRETLRYSQKNVGTAKVVDVLSATRQDTFYSLQEPTTYKINW